MAAQAWQECPRLSQSRFPAPPARPARPAPCGLPQLNRRSQELYIRGFMYIFTYMGLYTLQTQAAVSPSKPGFCWQGIKSKSQFLFKGEGWD